ncbi:MAG: DUF1549 and DUF1553 domain-containing protein [Gemmataceae bacterium]
MRRLVPALLFLFAASVRADEPPADWAYQPLRQPKPPAVRAASHPIDAFLLARLQKAGLGFASPADRATLIRRVTFDLIGLPPTPAEIADFVNDKAPDAYEKLVDRLLASPRYGERQATFWLDLVRYAESDGFKADDARPNAWRYRDYVIRSFNRDKPYDRFVKEQLAGDELFPNDFDAIIATGFLRHYPDEYNAINCEQRRQEILNDITDTTATAFLGVTLGCCRCHDHKFDPLLQIDYYRVQAFFAGFWPIDAPLTDVQERAKREQRLRDWNALTAELRRKIEELEKPYQEPAQKKERMRFPVEYAAILDIPPDQRTPLQKQLGAMVEKQVYTRSANVSARMKPPVKEQWQAMMKQMAEFEKQKPPPLPTAMACTDVGSIAPATHLLKRGDWRKPGEVVAPGFLSALDDREVDLPKSATGTTGRRSALANWIARPDNPLAVRAVVNRVWQSHFGKGIVGTPADLGVQGDRPTHPELLDRLANRFTADGWSLKRLHRLIVTSTAYQQSSRVSADAAKLDPENKLLSRMPRRRLEAEALRDSMLAVSGQLTLAEGGPSVHPELPAELKGSKWPVSPTAAERNRRSVYIAVKRNLRYPLLALFDAPDANETCARRYATTTAPQALVLLNDRIVLNMARHFAGRVLEQACCQPKVVEQAYVMALGRNPDADEVKTMKAFLTRQTEMCRHRERAKQALLTPLPGAEDIEPAFAAAVVDLCHAILNLNEFLFAD